MELIIVIVRSTFMLYTVIASIVYLSQPVLVLVCLIDLFVLHVLYSVFYLHWAPWKVVH